MLNAPPCFIKAVFKMLNKSQTADLQWGVFYLGKWGKWPWKGQHHFWERNMWLFSLRKARTWRLIENNRMEGGRKKSCRSSFTFERKGLAQSNWKLNFEALIQVLHWIWTEIPSGWSLWLIPHLDDNVFGYRATLIKFSLTAKKGHSVCNPSCRIAGKRLASCCSLI